MQRSSSHVVEQSLPDETVGQVPIGARRFVKMEYEASGQTPFLREQIIRIIKAVAANVTTVRQDPDTLRQLGDAIINPLIGDLLEVATRLKHHGFKEEREYRIVTFCPPDLFSPNDIGLIPRVSISFDPHCVKEVWIGPGQHMDTRESSVRTYFQKHKEKYPGVEVKRSDTPFTGK